MKKSLWIVLFLVLVYTLALSACIDTNQSQTSNSGHVHAFDEWKTIKKATCTEDGVNERYCTCGEKQTQSIWALGHTIVIDDAVAATCTTEGKTEGKHCSVCGTVLVVQTTISKLGHVEVIDAGVAATCTTDGKTEGKHCSVCNTVIIKQQSILKLEHQYENQICKECGIFAPDGSEKIIMKISDHGEILELGEILSGLFIAYSGTNSEIVLPLDNNNLICGIDSFGNFYIEERGTVVYNFNGTVKSIGKTNISYNFSNQISKIGSTKIYYNYSDQIKEIGNTKIYYNYSDQIKEIGNTKIYYNYSDQIKEIGNSKIYYNYSDQIKEIGNTKIYYNYSDQIKEIGNTKIYYNFSNQISKIGSTNISYNFNKQINKIGDTYILYNSNGKISQIGAG